jgi:mRNA interferase MazF
MRRGDIFLVDLSPTANGTSEHTRPAVLVSNDAANRTAERTGRGIVTVVPLTHNTSQVYPFQVFVAAGEGELGARSKAHAEQLRSVDCRRLGRRLGALKPATLRHLDEALRTHLAL